MVRYRFGWLALALLAPLAASAADLGIVPALQTPQVVFTRQAGVYLRQEARVQLPAGQSPFLLDFGRPDIDPATLELRVLQPAEGVRIVGRQFPPRQPGQVVFLLQAEQPAEALLRLSYALKGLEAEIGYTALLAPARQTLTLQAQVTLRNNGKQALPKVQVLLSSGQRLETGLEVGQSLQQPLLRHESVPYQVTYLYDNTRFKDSVRAIVQLPRTGTADFDKAPLPAGKLKVFAPTSGSLPTFVGESSLKYTPAHEKLELDLGIVPEITVLRTKLRGDQVNVRSDVYKKLAMFDSDEEYEFEIENHHASPVVLALQEHVAGEWQMVKASTSYRKLEAGTIELTVKLASGEKTKVGYSVKRLNVEP